MNAYDIRKRYMYAIRLSSISWLERSWVNTSKSILCFLLCSVIPAKIFSSSLLLKIGAWHAINKASIKFRPAVHGIYLASSISDSPTNFPPNVLVAKWQKSLIFSFCQIKANPIYFALSSNWIRSVPSGPTAKPFWTNFAIIKVTRLVNMRAYDVRCFSGSFDRPKGQLVSKCLVGIFISPKTRTKKFNFKAMVLQVELF